MDIRAKGLRCKNGDMLIFTPPIATDSCVGGIRAKERTTETQEIVIDPTTGRLYTVAPEVANVTLEGIDYTPLGIVEALFTGTEDTIYLTATPSGTISAPEITVTTEDGGNELYSVTDDGSYTPSSFNPGTTPHLYDFIVEEDSLKINDVVGTAPEYTAETVVMPKRSKTTITASAPQFTGDEMRISGVYTPKGTISATFTGEKASFTPSVKGDDEST